MQKTLIGSLMWYSFKKINLKVAFLHTPKTNNPYKPPTFKLRTPKQPYASRILVYCFFIVSVSAEAV